MYSVFVALPEKWRKSIIDKGGPKFLCFKKPMIHAGTRHALITEDRFLPAHLVALDVIVRVVGVPPSLWWVHYFIKFEWGICSQFQVQLYKESTYLVHFTSVLDYLRAADRIWDFIDDRTIVISRDPSEQILNENFENLPQWVLLTGLKGTMWWKEGIEAHLKHITMGVPLEAKHITMPLGHGVWACVMMEFSEELPSSILVTTIKGG